VVTGNGVTILGPTNLASGAAHDASVMYAKNVTAFLLHLVHDGRIDLDLKDEIIGGTLVARNGEVVHRGVRKALEAWDGEAPEGEPDEEVGP
jgi:NAD(P) transhydrogenase subunit alpha